MLHTGQKFDNKPYYPFLIDILPKYPSMRNIGRGVKSDLDGQLGIWDVAAIYH
jgi:hypothetical protein